MKWIVITSLAVVGGFMVFDGMRALFVGDYLTPSAGEHAGQLGPWADLVQWAGIDPRSTGMKTVFVAIGSVHLLAAGFLALSNEPLAISISLIAAASGLWYLPFGTAGSLIVIATITFTDL